MTYPIYLLAHMSFIFCPQAPCEGQIGFVDTEEWLKFVK